MTLLTLLRGSNLKIENIDTLSKIPNYFNTINIGLFTDKIDSSLLFFCNLLDDNYLYHTLEEQKISQLPQSNIRFNVLLINKNLSPNSIEQLFEYSRRHNTKIIYAPTNPTELKTQKKYLTKYDLIIIQDSKLKNSLNNRNINLLAIPSTLDEEYEFIKQSKLFNEEKYISKYQLSIDDDFDPIQHYLTVGTYENCNPFRQLKLNAFLTLYPEIKEYDISAFTYYLILKEFYKIMAYYPFENIIYHPSLFRVLLWDKNVFADIERHLRNEYKNVQFEITEQSDKLVFKQKNKLSEFKYDYLMDMISKTNLMIKNRSTGKRILKEIKDYEVELTRQDLFELGIHGIYDFYVQTSTLNKDSLFRINFDEENNNIMLLDNPNNMVFWAYETLDHYLAFKYEKSNFAVRCIKLENEDGKLALNGEITLFDDIAFDSVELLIPLNQADEDRKVITCDYEKQDNTINFTGPIDFKYYSTDIGQHFKVNVRLKDESGTIITDYVIPNYH